MPADVCCAKPQAMSAAQQCSTADNVCCTAKWALSTARVTKQNVCCATTQRMSPVPYSRQCLVRDSTDNACRAKQQTLCDVPNITSHLPCETLDGVCCTT